MRDNEFTFEIIHHEKPLSSAKAGAGYFGIELQTAPTLIIKTDKGYYSLVVSGSRGKVDFEKVAEILDCSKVNLTTPKEVQEVTGYEVEAVPMIGLEIPYVIEARLLNYEFIYGGTGQPSATLKIEPRALEEMN